MGRYEGQPQNSFKIVESLDNLGGRGLHRNESRMRSFDEASELRAMIVRCSAGYSTLGDLWGVTFTVSRAG
jgi:hypothetical protein